MCEEKTKATSDPPSTAVQTLISSLPDIIQGRITIKKLRWWNVTYLVRQVCFQESLNLPAATQL